tara:strand:- start:508 stop:813 length:306 start_codon:yes stop_codon:yes gene_type:complete
MKPKCTQCLHYYEIRGRKICRSPHLELGGDEFITSVKGKVEAPVDCERSSFGKCGREGKNLELCEYRKARYPLWGTVYDEKATRMNGRDFDKFLSDLSDNP